MASFSIAGSANSFGPGFLVIDFPEFNGDRFLFFGITVIDRLKGLVFAFGVA